MTYEETQLIYEDLCSRIPFGVAYHWKGRTTEDDMPHFLSEMNEWMIFYIQQGFVKPYLRPMTSMTKEEMEEYNKLWDDDRTKVWTLGKELEKEYKKKEYDSIWQHPVVPIYKHIDWLNANHFDYRGLIEKGLALEAPEGMYKTE